MPTLVNQPTRPYRSATIDSRRWDGFRPRQGDIVVATYPKCGTTWMQRIVDLLLHQSPAPRQFNDAAPWLDATFFAPVEQDLATLEALTGRRQMKSHMPLDSLPVYEGVKVVHVVRDGRDACISMHNHMLGFVPHMRELIVQAAASDGMDAGPGRIETPEDPRAFFLGWMAAAEAEPPGPDLPFFAFEESYWRRRTEPWLLFVHYNDLKADLVGEMRRISEFLEIDTPETVLPTLAEAARFETMKRQGDEMLPKLRLAFDRGADRFINAGTNGRWKAFLTEADIARYEALAEHKLGPALRAYVEHGRRIAGDPRVLADA